MEISVKSLDKKPGKSYLFLLYRESGECGENFCVFFPISRLRQNESKVCTLKANSLQHSM